MSVVLWKTSACQENKLSVGYHVQDSTYSGFLVSMNWTFVWLQTLPVTLISFANLMSVLIISSTMANPQRPTRCNIERRMPPNPGEVDSVWYVVLSFVANCPKIICQLTRERPLLVEKTDCQLTIMFRITLTPVFLFRWIELFCVAPNSACRSHFVCKFDVSYDYFKYNG